MCLPVTVSGRSHQVFAALNSTVLGSAWGLVYNDEEANEGLHHCNVHVYSQRATTNAEAILWPLALHAMGTYDSTCLHLLNTTAGTFICSNACLYFYCSSVTCALNMPDTRTRSPVPLLCAAFERMRQTHTATNASPTTLHLLIGMHIYSSATGALTTPA